MPLSVADLSALIIVGSIGLFLGIVILGAVRKIEAAAEMILRAQRPGYRRSGVVTRLSRNPLISTVAPGDREMEEGDTLPLPAIDEL